MSTKENDETTTSASASASASAAASTNYDDATIAQTLQCYEQLTFTYSFPAEVAQTAMEAVGPDPVVCYNYILDNGLANDAGGPVVPKADCPHIANHVCLSVDDLDKTTWQECTHFRMEESGKSSRGGLKSEFGEGESCPQGQNWICLECNMVRCSRYVNGHGKAHWEATKASKEEQGEDLAGHCIAVSMEDLSVWCYECNAYLHHERLKPFVKRMEELKFDSNDDGDHDDCVNKDNECNDDGYDSQPDNADNDRISNGNPLTQKDDQQNRGTKRASTDDMYDDDSDHDSECDENDSVDDGIYYQHSHIEKRPVVSHPNLPSSMKGLADFIKSDQCRSIIVLSGAGMSRSSGIPDFRSAGGLYDSLDPALLTATSQERDMMSIDPTFVFDKTLFMENSLPCLETNRPFILGTRDQKWKATLAHRFLELLASKTNKLTRVYTQNIDGLEGQCIMLPKEKVIPVHGSMDRVACEACGAEMDFTVFCQEIKTKIKDISQMDPGAPAESSFITCATCNKAAVKPTIVLFHSRLPEEFFFSLQNDLPGVDLLLVMGTSLSVAPANQIVALVPDTTIRVVMNKEPVGYRLGIDYSESPERDYFCRGTCDEVALNLIKELGWVDDLKAMVNDLPGNSRELISKFESS